MALVCVAMAACGGVADESKLPPNVQDPATLKTPSGAVARYRGALANVGGVFDRVMTLGGMLTDELAALPVPLGVSGPYTAVDSRADLSGQLTESPWSHLHRLRAEAREARGFLAAYAPDSSPALQGHLYAVEAYAEIWLADLFCSGIPLSTLDFDGNYTLAPGSTTADVYRHAAALFDSALALASDSVWLQHLAAVGKGRALLALGQYAEAAAAVRAVPGDYTYNVSFTPVLDYHEPPDSTVLWYASLAYQAFPGMPSVADREGQNGLNYRSSGDPRTAVQPLGTDAMGDTMYFPVKYPQSGQAQYTLASGIEARLIEAEAALNANAADGQWLTTLNQLRETAGLPDTTDPGSPESRVDLLFRERAFWLYLTGHREGDLRRLIRNYMGRSPEQVYPTGPYPGAGGTYGSEVVVPVPTSERELNTKYTGCFHLHA